MRKPLQISSLLGILLLSGGLHGAGLGKLSVQSYLGQPLRAEIELLSVQKDELQAINAKLAGADAFRQARIERTDALGSLRFAVDQRANGQPIVRVTSTGPMNEPFVDMLVELNWTSGRLLREYTILLDPPAELRAQAAAAQPPITAPAAPAASKPAPSPEPAKVQAPVAQAVTSPPAAGKYGPVKSGETLRGIAAKVKPGDTSLDQTMVGLFQHNPDAFMGANMNRLKKGRTLSVPDADKLRAVSPDKAARTVRAHVVDWQAYRQRIADQAAQEPAVAAPEKAAEGKVAPKPDARPATPAAPSQDVLKLSKGGPGAGPDAKTLEKLNALEEELAARSRALNEAQQRVTQLENTVRDLQRLMELRAQEAAKKPAEPAPAAPKAEPPAAPPPVAAEPAPEPVPEAAPAPEVKPAPAFAKPAPAPLPVPVTNDEGSWLKTFITNPIYIGGIIAAILLSVLLWMMMVGNRRKQGLTSFEDSIMTGGEFKHDAVFKTGGAAAAAGTPTEGSMLLTDFSRLGLGSIDTHEVDPIAEAEVYMAYGRDAQAEEILKEALGKDPSRHEITLKLLEIYASRKDTVAFETHASELYAALGGQPTPLWQQAAEMGRGIDPGNPLYRVGNELGLPLAGAMASAAIARAAQAEPPSPITEPPLAAPDLAGLEALEPAATDNLIEFDAAEVLPESKPEPAWNVTPEEQPAVAELAPTVQPFAEPEVPGLEADEQGWAESLQPSPAYVPEPAALGEEIAEFAPPVQDVPVEDQPLDDGFGLEAPTLAETPAPVPEAAAMPEFSLDDLELPEAIEVVEPAAIEAAVPELDLSGIDLELNEPLVERAVEAAPPDIGIDPELWEEVNTKLDLARAYLEMGDKEGAREILQEVLNEGDGNQKGDASQLMAQCA